MSERKRRSDRDQRRRSLSQNFLVDQALISELIDDLKIGEDELVVDLGAGSGALTVPLASKGARVWAVERDPVWADRLVARALDAKLDDRIRDQVGPSPAPIPSRTIQGRRQPSVQPHDRHPEADPRQSFRSVCGAGGSRAPARGGSETQRPAAEHAEDLELVAVVGILGWTPHPSVCVSPSARGRRRRSHNSPPRPTHPANMARHRVRGPDPHLMATATPPLTPRSSTAHPASSRLRPSPQAAVREPPVQVERRWRQASTSASSGSNSMPRASRYVLW